MSIAAVVFDIGGVVQDSPLHAIARYEQEHGIEPGAINRAVVAAGEGGAWARLERGELTVAAFCEPFETECRTRGAIVDARRLMAAISEAGVPRPLMLEAIRRIRARGLRAGALTNNWVGVAPGGVPDVPRRGAHALRDHFDVVVESAVVGLRKPDPRIYALVCEKLALAPARVAFLDDIGRNLKPARELGMTTIKVDGEAQALADLAQALGFALE
jgi:putative hydrolase of the HAD superfamily